MSALDDMGQSPSRRRIACLVAAELPLQAALRAEPSLVGAAFVVTEGQGGRGKVVAVSPAAASLGARAGMTLAQAEAVAAALQARSASAAMLESASDALVDVARGFATRVERAALDCVYLEVGDLRRLFPRETGLVAALEAASQRVGLAVRVGLAGTKAAARIAAKQSADGAATLVPHGGERAFLAPLPVALAEPKAELAAALARFGLRTLGAVAALPGDGLGRRLGREGAALWRLARGEDDTTLTPESEPEVFGESVALDYALDSTEPLAFLLQGALSRLCARLCARGLACAGLTLHLELSPRGTQARDVAVAAPTLEAPILVSLVRLSLESRPPPSPVHGFRVVAVAVPAQSAQLGLFDPLRPAPARLAATVARLSALCGAEHVGAPAVVDALRPEVQAVTPFEPPPPSPPRVPVQRGLFDPPPPSVEARAPVDAPIADGAGLRSSEAPPPLSEAAPAAPRRVLTLRRIEPPRPSAVRLWGGQPIALDGARLVHVAGPWRLGGEWWLPVPFARDYYDVETHDGRLCRVYRALPDDAWWTDGVYD